jgi:hypothetical protein
MTLPAVWDNRIETISSGLAGFFVEISSAVTSKAVAFVETWRKTAADAMDGFSEGFSGIRMDSLWASIVEGAKKTLNDGVFTQLGARNAKAYKDGWETVMQIASPSRVAEGWGRNIVAGLERGMSNTVFAQMGLPNVGVEAGNRSLSAFNLASAPALPSLGISAGGAGGGTSYNTSWEVHAHYAEIQSETTVRDTIRALQLAGA